MRIRKLPIIAAACLLGGTVLAITAFPANAVTPEELVWQSITFGQSTDLSFSANVLPEKVGTNYAAPDFPGTIDGSIVVESRGGKLASGHDGITFYYTTLDPNLYNFVLEADITIDQFGSEVPGVAVNSQDAAGIMVRDVIGSPRQDPMVLGYEEVVAASNIFGVSMKHQGPAAIQRTGVIYPWGNVGSTNDFSRFSSAYPTPIISVPIRMRLERTDTEFIMSATLTQVSPPVTFERRATGADWVQVIDPDHMYVGFFAARNAKMTVTNASISLSEANTQPRPPVEVKPPAAALDIVSPPDAAADSYDLTALTNYAGTISVSQDGSDIVRDAPVTAFEAFTHSTALTGESTQFSVTFTPTGALSAEPITRSITVTKRVFNHGAGLYVSPSGTPDAAGTLADPIDLATAVRYVRPGETIFLRGGTYQPPATVNISAPYSGRPGQLKTLAPYNGEKVVLDGRNTLAQVIALNADYWHITGFEITRAAGNALRLNGNHNIIELMKFSYNGNTGFQISGSGLDPARWPSHNLVINCESHDNRDPADADADGFAAKLGVGEGNVFRGNVAHHNIDDGWDLYNRINEGANAPIVLEGNVSYSNGKLSNGYGADRTIGNGFKLGGESMPVAHIVRGNVAFDNNMDGFTDNFNPGKLIVENNTAYNNKRFNFIFRFNPYFPVEQQGVFRGNLSFRSEGTQPDFISGDVDATNFFFDGTGTRNVTAADFVSLSAPAGYGRDANANIAWGDFLRPAAASELVDQGPGGSYAGALVPVWSASNVYRAGATVSHQGRTYVAGWWTRAHAPGDPWGPWQEHAQDAYGRSIWTASRIFTAGDRVSHAGQVYEAQWWTRNQRPGDPHGPWKLIS